MTMPCEDALETPTGRLRVVPGLQELSEVSDPYEEARALLRAYQSDPSRYAGLSANVFGTIDSPHVMITQASHAAMTWTTVVGRAVGTDNGADSAHKGDNCNPTGRFFPRGRALDRLRSAGEATEALPDAHPRTQRHVSDAYTPELLPDMPRVPYRNG